LQRHYLRRERKTEKKRSEEGEKEARADTGAKLYFGEEIETFLCEIIFIMNSTVLIYTYAVPFLQKDAKDGLGLFESG